MSFHYYKANSGKMKCILEDFELKFIGNEYQETLNSLAEKCSVNLNYYGKYLL